MGCSPSVLLEHLHRDSSTNQDKRAIKKTPVLPCANNKKDANRSVVNRKSSLPLTPEDELLDIYKPTQDTRYGHLLPPLHPLTLLAVYSQFDASTETLLRSAEKLGFDVTFCDNYDNALEEFQTKSYDLIFIDTRSSKLEYDTLCRSIRNTKGSQWVVIVAVIKKSVYDSDDVIVTSLLESGFNRCITETTNSVVWINELNQLKLSDCRPLAQQSTAQALYAALDRCKDVVLITDDSCRLQYINTAAEQCLGFHPYENLGKTLQEQLSNDPGYLNSMTSRLARNRTWQGHLTFKRKCMDPLNLYCQAVPVICTGRMPTHFVIVLDSSGHIEMLPQSRGSVHSIRKGSVDVRSINSDYYRRTSIAKLSALPLEAPITKIANLISQAQDAAGSNQQIVTMLDKVTEMLRNTELYSPHMKEDTKFRADEPVASDLIGALLSSHQLNTSRRSSNDSTITRSSSNIRAISKIKVPAQIKELLDHSLSWDFNIIRFEELTSKRPLLYLGMNLMSHFDVPYTLNIDEKTLYNFLILVESKYHSTNLYHNSTHAADVLQAVAVYMNRERMKALMDPFDEASSLIAAACHDIDHPGKSSAFLSNSDSELAVLYNDIAVLESHHASLTFKLALADDRVNIFKNLERDTYKMVRQNIIDMILATEMTKHFEHLTKFVSSFSIKNSGDEDHLELSATSLPENISLVKRMMIKCADVSNPTRPLTLCVEWSRRITEEYFQQTDEEKHRGLPVVMPMFDRTTCSLPKAQIGFIDFIIIDMMETWNSFIDFPEIVAYMRQNYIKWKEYDEQGYTTVADIKRLQATVLAPSKSTPTVAE